MTDKKSLSEMKTRYADIFGTKGQVEALVDRISAPVDAIVKAAEVALDLFPDGLRFGISLRGSARDVQEYYRQRYGKDCDYIAFSSLGSKTIFLSVEDVTDDVLVHEIGHIIVELSLRPRPPYRLHELMAQFCEKNYTLRVGR